jgi:hypothetical protein
MIDLHELEPLDLRLDDYQHDPDLGWVSPGHISQRKNPYPPRSPGVFRVLAMGLK